MKQNVDLGSMIVSSVTYKVGLRIRSDQQAEFTCIMPDGSELKAQTFASLRELVKVAASKQKKPVSIPVCKEEGDTIEDYEITGIHSGNDNLLYRPLGSKEAAKQAVAYTDFLRPVSQKDRETLAGIHKEIDNLNKRAQDIVDSHAWPTRLLKAEVIKLQKG